MTITHNTGCMWFGKKDYIHGGSLCILLVFTPWSFLQQIMHALCPGWRVCYIHVISKSGGGVRHLRVSPPSLKYIRREILGTYWVKNELVEARGL